MSKRLNLTPTELRYIIDSMDTMKNSIISSSETLRRDTIQMQTKWDDDQFEIFKETVKNFVQQLNMMSDRLETEKQRVIRYQKESQQTSENFSL